MTSVLFLCTGNSCRSIMAEAMLNHYGDGKWRGFSAGSHPTGKVHLMSIKTLKKRDIETKYLKSKSLDYFASERIDILLTVCDQAAGESCPIFLGDAVKSHWGVRDPAKFEGSKKDIADEFSAICDVLERRIQMLIHLPIERMSKDELKAKFDMIGGI